MPHGAQCRFTCFILFYFLLLYPARICVFLWSVYIPYILGMLYPLYAGLHYVPVQIIPCWTTRYLTRHNAVHRDASLVLPLCKHHRFIRRYFTYNTNVSAILALLYVYDHSFIHTLFPHHPLNDWPSGQQAQSFIRLLYTQHWEQTTWKHIDVCFAWTDIVQQPQRQVLLLLFNVTCILLMMLTMLPIPAVVLAHTPV